MIVTASATEAESHHALTQSIDCVLNCQMMIIFGVESKSPRNGQEPCRGNSLRVFFTGSVFGEQVTRDLFTNEFIVWLIDVESIYHIIAVPPRHRHRIVSGIACGIRITRNIE